METVIITGGSGMIGTALTKLLLQQGYYIIILTRDVQKATKQNKFSDQVEYAYWNITSQTMDISAIQKADYVIHLAGAGVVDHKWTDAYKKEIIDSRIKSAQLLIQTLRTNKDHVKAFISASAIGWYGPDTEKSLSYGFNEAFPADDHFLGRTCKLWEESVLPVEQMGIRRISLRLGIVLSNEGGALVEFKKPLQLGLATIMGNGTQIVSWIHINDLVHMIQYALENDALHGSYNAVAPHPVSNKIFVQTLARAMRKSSFLTVNVPAWVLRLMLGERSDELLKSTTVSSEKIQNAGYQFGFPTIENAIKDLIR